VVTWTLLPGSLGELISDQPTRVVLIGVAVSLAVAVGLLRWASQHYVGSAATGWEMTTWERFIEAEGKAAEQRPCEAEETTAGPRPQSDRGEAT
jgi:hypothetical protein